ncbi:MAG: LysR family transcriptional regulator [Pseudomonadota bacterium]
MDWRSVAFDWNRTRAFLVAAEEGSLSAAARALGQTQPTLGRQIRALEDELGIALFERAAAGLAPTQAGLELLDHVRAMAEAAGHVSRLASGQSRSVEGTVRLSVTQAYAVHLLPAMLRRLRDKAPALQVEVVASNETADLRRREADIAVRHVQPQDPELIGRRVADHPAALFAAPSYLASIPPLERPEDFVHAAFIGFDDNRMWRDGLLAAGLTLGETPFPWRTADHNAHWAMAIEGLGIGVGAAIIGDAEPRLVRAAPWLPDWVIPVWLVAHRELATSRRIRLVFDHLAEEIAALSRRP